MNIEILDSHFVPVSTSNTGGTSLILLTEISKSFPFFKSFACSSPSHPPSYDSPSYFFSFSYFLPRTHAYYLIQSNDMTIITYQTSSILSRWNPFAIWNFFCCEFFTRHSLQIIFCKVLLFSSQRTFNLLWYQNWWQSPSYHLVSSLVQVN